MKTRKIVMWQSLLTWVKMESHSAIKVCWYECCQCAINITIKKKKTQTQTKHDKIGSKWSNWYQNYFIVYMKI